MKQLVRAILVASLIIVTLISLLLFLIHWQIAGIPSIIMDNAVSTLFGGENSKKVLEQWDRITKYQEIVTLVHEEDKPPKLEDAIESLSDCSEINVTDTFDLDWQDLMTVDTIRIQQNFRKKIEEKKVREIGNTFIDIKTSKRWEKRYDSDGGSYTILVGYVVCKTRDFNDTEFEKYYLKDNFKKSAQGAEYMSWQLHEIYVGEENSPEEDIDSTELPEIVEGENITTVNYYNQAKGYWSQKVYGRGTKTKTNTYTWSGCGPTAAAIVFSTLKNDTSIDPYTMGELFYKKNLRFDAGTAHNAMVVAAKEYGLKSDFFAFNQTDKLVNHLNKGHIVTSVLGRNKTDLYGGRGHFVVINGIRETNGKVEVYVTDPAYSKKNGWWDINTVVTGSKNFSAVWD